MRGARKRVQSDIVDEGEDAQGDIVDESEDAVGGDRKGGNHFRRRPMLAFATREDSSLDDTLWRHRFVREPSTDRHDLTVVRDGFGDQGGVSGTRQSEHCIIKDAALLNDAALGLE